MIKLVLIAFVIGVLVGIAIWHIYHTVVIGKLRAGYHNLISKALAIKNSTWDEGQTIIKEVEAEFTELKSKL